jgi:hypothetical protein
MDNVIATLEEWFIKPHAPTVENNMLVKLEDFEKKEWKNISKTCTTKMKLLESITLYHVFQAWISRSK